VNGFLPFVKGGERIFGFQYLYNHGPINKKGNIVVKALVSVCIVLLLLSVPVSFAQVNPTPPKTQEGKPQGYPVMLGDQVLFSLRDIRGFSGEERAKTISDRIRKIAEDPGIQVASLKTLSYQQPISLVAAGDELIVAILEEDAEAEGRTRQELAADYSQRVSNAIEKYRRDYSLKRILIGALYSLLATLVLTALLYLLSKLYRKGEARIQTWLSSKKVHIGIQSFEVVRAERISALLIGAVKIIRDFVILVILYTYAHLLLSFFPWTQAFSGQLFDYVMIPLNTVGKGVWTQIPNLLFITIIAWITYYALKLTRLFFLQVEKGTLTFKNFYPEWAQPTYKICRWLLIAFAAVVAFPYVPGSNSPAFKGISIFVGVLFSLGSSSAIANLVAGFTLTYRRAFKVGDRIKIADFLGDVLEMRLQVTRLRTIKNEEIIVPNSMIVNNHVINYSSLAREKGLILHTAVTIGYDAAWRQVHAMLLMAAEKTPGLLREPAPFVLQKSLDDFYVTYELNAYTDKPLEMARLYSELHQNIQDAFNESGVQIMSPHYESDPSGPKFVPKERWYAPPARPPDDPGNEG
jgi:small-conductance mechanosensitive channel